MQNYTEQTYSVTFNVGDYILDLINKKEVPNLITLPYLTLKGFSREEITKFFLELEAKEFAQYIPGRVGKGHCAKVILGEKCPTTYVMSMTVKRVSKRIESVVVIDKIEQVEQATSNNEDEVVPASNKGGMSGYNVDSHFIASSDKEDFIKNTERKPIKSVPRKEYGKGYVCTFGSGFLFIDRVNQAGYDTMLEAVEDVWEEVEGKVSIFKSKIMSEAEQVTSILMGRGFVKLEGQ